MYFEEFVYYLKNNYLGTPQYSITNCLKPLQPAMNGQIDWKP